MPEPNRVVIEKLDWKSILPVLRLVSALKHALQPGKLLVALVAVLAIHLSGTVLDLIWSSASDSDAAGVYESISATFSQYLSQLFESVLDLELGIGSGAGGVLGALHGIFIALPEWAFSEHPWFSLLFGIDVVFILTMSSGILTRMASTQVCRQEMTSPGQAIGHVSRRWSWYLLTPLMPALLAVIIGLVLLLAGLVFFNVAVLDVIGSLGYGLLLLLGFIVTAVTLLLLFALFLMPPALSVEGSDGFDAIARSFNYILFRPWQFATYFLAALLYLAVVYALASTVAALSIDATHSLIELGAVGDEPSRHEQIVSGDPRDAGGTIGFNAWVVSRWIELVTAIVLAILLSTLCCLQTQVYVLMRRSADGTPLDQCDASRPVDLWAGASAGQADTEETAEAEG